MSEAPPADLVRALRAAAIAAPPSDECPPSDTLWALAAGELPPERAESIVDHIGSCPACGEALALAVEMGTRPEVSANEATYVDETPVATEPESAPPRGGRGWIAMGGTLLAAGIAVWLVGHLAPEPPLPEVERSDVVRGGDASGLRADSDDTLPRDEFVLQWSGGPPGTTFEVRLLDEELDVLHEQFDVPMGQLRIPAKALEGVEAGTELRWMIRAHLPDGQTISSPTWDVKLR